MNRTLVLVAAVAALSAGAASARPDIISRDATYSEPPRYVDTPRYVEPRYVEAPVYVDRPVYVERETYAVTPPQPASSWGGIELYSEPRFRGVATRLSRDAHSLESRAFDKRASSVIVKEGQWELCTREYHRGTCAVFGPGEYPSLGERMDDRVSSVRRVG
jgi:hypothetical protein